LVVLVVVGVLTIPAFAEKSVIRFLTDETDPKSIKVYNGMEKRFEKAYPQYDLQIEFISLSDVWPKLMASIQAKAKEARAITTTVLSGWSSRKERHTEYLLLLVLCS
jgi:ABC-type glycerol-3-phosphate transport system substrate-binding protein